MKQFFKILLLWSSLPLLYGYNILCVFPVCGYSHFTVGFRLVKELAHRGHTVTFINCFPQKDPINNLRDVSVEEAKHNKELIAKISDSANFGKLSHWGQLQWMLEFGQIISLYTLRSKSVQDLMFSNETFDVVIMENFIYDSLSIFHYRFNCPLILIAPGPNTMFNNHLVGNPWNPSFVPNLLAHHDSNMSFWQRLQNTYRQIAAEIFVHLRHIPTQNMILKKVFPDAPDLSTIVYNVSLFLLGSHVSVSNPVPLQANVKLIGGYHVTPPKPLPKHIKEFLDNAKERAILFSLGSILNSSHFNKKTKKALFSAFSKIKQKVICSFDVSSSEKYDNVMVLDWLPQQDILAHPNIIGFISHGGLLGILEAVHYGVPILGLPVFWDQTKNIEEAVKKGFGIRFDLKDINEKTFIQAVNKLVNNKKYLRAATERSKIMHHQPIKQMEEAVFWVEYVVRHKGAHHLKSTARLLNWYQRYLVDIVLFIILVLIIIIIILTIILKLLFGTKNCTKIKLKNN